METISSMINRTKRQKYFANVSNIKPSLIIKKPGSSIMEMDFCKLEDSLN